MQPNQVRHLLLQVARGPFFGDEPYDLELRTRCSQYKTGTDPLPTDGRIYVIRAKGDPLWVYVGQSKNLRTRIQHLQGIFKADEMPFTDPHNAGPALWAWMKNQSEIKLEVIVTPLEEDSAYWRQGLEHFAIAYHRWQFGCSPRWQFSRIPQGWSPSTNKKRGMRGRCIPADVALSCHQPGIVPITKLFEDQSDPLTEYWAGHHWSPWYSSVNNLPPIRPGQRGLYRLRRGDQLLFLGIFGIRKDEIEKDEMDDEEEAGVLSLTRIKKRTRTMPLERIFQEAGRQGVEGSFVSGAWLDHELRELWSDIVALYLRQQLALPQAQFGGDEDRSQMPNVQETMRSLYTWLSPMVSRGPFPLAG